MARKIITHMLFLLLGLAILQTTAYAGHSHRALKRRHRRRQATTTATTSPSSAAEIVEGVVAQDLDKIEDGLSSLPNDLLIFMVAVQNQLQQAEDLLSSLINQAKTPQTSAPATSSSTTLSLVPSQYIPSTLVTSAHPTLTPFSTEPTAPASATSRTRVTYTLHRTSTFYEIVTIPAPKSTPIYGNATRTFSKPTAATSSRSKTTISSKSSVPVLMPYYSKTTSYELASTSTTSPSQPTSTYVFDASSNSNVAVYYGQSPDTQSGDLTALCTNPNIDIVILAFVTSFFSPSGMPSANFGSACSGSTRAQQLHAPGLSDCSSLAPEILNCQTIGKKVLISLGGYTGTTSIPTADAATQLADNLWDLFGGGTGYATTLRPFGPNVTLDGFDIDNETRDPAYYDVLAARLRSNFAADNSRTYYLSAAPQCPRPDTSVPLSMMAYADFVWVQFYNNPSCDLSGEGFAQSFRDWSADLRAVSNSTRLYIGAGAFEGAGSGYVAGDELANKVDMVTGLGLTNFGGIMLWDASRAMENEDASGGNYVDYAKASLTS